MSEVARAIFFELRRLHLKGATGMLFLDTATAKLRVRFRRGEAISVTGAESFGRKLLRDGVLSATEYAALVLALLRERRSSDDDVAFAGLLTTVRALPARGVNLALTASYRERLVNAIASDSLSFCFEEMEDADDVEAHQVATVGHLGSLLLRAARVMPQQRLFDILGGKSIFPLLEYRPEEMVGFLGLEPALTAFLKQLDGTRPVSDLLKARLEGGVSPVHVLAVLRMIGAVSPLSYRLSGSMDTAARSPTKMVSFHATSDATTTMISLLSSSPFRAVSPRTSVRPMVMVPNRATIPAPAVGATMPPGSEHADAERLFARARRLIACKKPAEAVALLEHACKLVPGYLVYETYLRCAELLQRASTKDDLSARLALRGVAIAAIAEDPSFSFGYYALAYVAVLEGKKDEADRMVALAMDRSDGDAHQVDILSRLSHRRAG